MVMRVVTMVFGRYVLVAYAPSKDTTNALTLPPTNTALLTTTMLLFQPVARPLQPSTRPLRHRNLNRYPKYEYRYRPVPFIQQQAQHPTTPSSMQMAISAPQPIYSNVVATSAAAAVPSAGGGASFFQLLFAFLAGGLFFSAFAAAITAKAALGKQNIQRFREIAKIVATRVWNIYCHGLVVAWETFYEGKRWRWRESYRVLKEQLTLTRQAAREGVQAIKLEANLYARATGKPFFLQHFVDHLTPRFIAATAEKAFIDALRNVRNKNIRKIRLEEFSFGRKSPQLESARVYELGDNGVAFDVDMEWDSELVIELKVTGSRIGVTLPVTVKNVRFEGVVRSVLTPLTEDPPGFGAALVSFPMSPKISFDLRMAGGEITQMPWLRTEVMKAMERVIAEEFLWPKRVVIPSPAPQSTRPRPMLSYVELESLRNSDPLLKAETELAANVIYQKTQLKREIPSEESLQMDVLLKDETGEIREGKVVVEEADIGKRNAKRILGEQWKQIMNNLQRQKDRNELRLKNPGIRKRYGKRNIIFNFDNPNAAEGDWIGIFKAGSVQNGEIASDALQDWSYACGSKNCDTAATSGTITFTTDSIPSGSYEAFFVRQDRPPYLVETSKGLKFTVV